MAATNLVVDPAELRLTSTNIKNLADKYKIAWQAVFAAFQNVDNAWDGTDNAEFNEKVNSFRHDFEAMSAFFESLQNYLNTSAQNYEEAQNDVTNKAKTLKK